MNNQIIIPQGRLAADDAALAAKRAALKERLVSGKTVTVTPGDGNAVNGIGSDSKITIPKGKLAADDAALKAKREALKKKLMGGEKITLKGDGNVTGESSAKDATISIPKGKLAAQWYESNPALLEAEKAAMAKCFPNFELGKLEDGRLYWTGELAPGVYETKFGRKKSYTVMAVYQNNHPVQQMGSSVFVYPVLPDADDLIKDGPFCIAHMLYDSVREKYICTANADDIKVGNTNTTAASVLAWAVKWLLAYELVLTGEATAEEFRTHGLF